MLEKLIKEIKNAEDLLPPVHLWEPDFCGEIDIHIKRNGQWFHEGDLIKRQQLVNLFSKVLRLDDDGHYYLVTPAEKLKIQVDDVPLLTVKAECIGEGKDQKVCLTTDTGYQYIVDADHPVYVEFDEQTGEPRPYSTVRGNLKSLLSRTVYMSLVDWGMKSEVKKGNFGFWSSDQFFELGSLE